MSLEDLERLRQEEAELQARLQEAKRKREQLEAEEKAKADAEKLRKELEKEITVKVTALSGGSLITESEFRPDLLNLWKSIPGRAFQGYTGPEDNKVGRNLIPASRWSETEERLLKLPFLTVEWKNGVREDLDWYLNAPPWEILVHPSRRDFIAKMGPRQSSWRVFSHIPGSDWDHDSKSWKIPMTEGWRIHKALEGIEGVVYEDAAREIILHQVERRSALDKIARQEDSDAFAGVLTQEVEARGKVKPLWEHMLPFQRVGTEFIHTTGGRTLLADATGLGKTWQVLAFAEVKRSEAREAGEREFQSVMVVKAANLPNWIREIRRLTGEEPVVCKTGKPDGTVVLDISVKRKPYVLISHDTLGIYRTMVRDSEEDEWQEMDRKKDSTDNWVHSEVWYIWQKIIEASEPDLVAVDEAHLIKSPDTHRSKAARKLAGAQHVIPMTASPVLNRTEEFWPLLYMLNPHVFKSHSQFVNTYTVGGRRARNVDELHELLRPMFLRRKKADVLKDLPAINRVVRYHDLTKDARDRYDMVLAGIYEHLKEFDVTGQGGGQSQVMNILSQITRLKQVCAADKIEYTTDLAQELVDEQNGDLDKGKVLIFSQFKGTAYALAQQLGHEAVCTVRKGATDFVSLGSIERDRMFEDARHDPSVKYIVTTEAAKEGHNLEFCNWVIFNDLFWTPAGHDQCEGRAYGRLSNPHPIDSFYIVADVNVETWIMELLEKKLEIIGEAVEQIEASRDVDGSIGMELIKRMKEEMWSR